MRSGPPSALLCVLALLAATVVAGGAGATALQTTTDPGEMTIEVALQPNGDARWTVTTTFPLNDTDDTRAFEALAERFESDEEDTAYGIEPFQRAATEASEATGRRMAITDVRYSSEIESAGNNSTGRLVLSFTWTQFATTDGEEYVVGDAFNTTDGTWLTGLSPDQTLVVRTPQGYGVFDAPKQVEQGALVWEGPTSFEPGELQITYTRSANPTTPTLTPTPGEPGENGTLLLVALLALGLGGLGVGGYLYTRRSDGGEEPDPAPAAEPEPAADAEDEPDFELLSDEERVEYMLEQNGGRMKQANIVKETGWSNAKVSQLLSAMDEEGRIDKLRIGRENLISLPDEEIADFDE
ncbi:helix-turn-helix transcriptional regulator [Natronomonas sp. EA1]|uniref:helix-turn-helix transcriptional regulator n=1 Tax=Natronomonas sp. EA1 TaxID=3421655 RepID=UPI003EB8A1FF